MQKALQFYSLIQKSNTKLNFVIKNTFFSNESFLSCKNCDML